MSQKSVSSPQIDFKALNSKAKMKIHVTTAIAKLHVLE